MFQTFFSACVLLFGVGYALYKKVIQMLKDIDEKYEGKLKTLVFELKVKHQVSINQLLKDIDEKYELKVNHQESIQKLENTIAKTSQQHVILDKSNEQVVRTGERPWSGHIT